MPFTLLLLGLVGTLTMVGGFVVGLYLGLEHS